MDVFSRCFKPERIFNRYTHHFEYVSCGKCPSCLNSYASKITRRVSDEIKQHRFSLMFTLTYDNDSLPRFEVFPDSKGCAQIRPIGRIADSYRYLPLGYFETSSTKDFPCFNDAFIPAIQNDDVVSEFAVCSKYDVQCFMKRLRQRINKFKLIHNHDRKIRYFISSEYGPKTFRPHYHGIIFFDNEELLGQIQSAIVSSWGRFERVAGRRNAFIFRPFASTELTSRYIKLCDVNTAYYVADYVAGNTCLPPVLQLPCTRPFHLCSQSPLIGSYKVDYSKMLEDVDNGVIEYGSLRVERQQGCIVSVSVPYSESDLRSLFIKCQGFRDLSSYAKSRLYGFCFDKRSVWLQEVGRIKPVDVSLSCWLVRFPYYNFRNWSKRHYPIDYFVNDFDVDVNWYASLRACVMIERYGIFRDGKSASCVDRYLGLVDRFYYLSAQRKLKEFYRNYNDWFEVVGPSVVFLAYPFLAEKIPYFSYNFRYMESGYRNLLLTYGLNAKVYKADGSLNRRYLYDFSPQNNHVYINHYVDQLHRFQKRSKSKKANNSVYLGYRRID